MSSQKFDAEEVFIDNSINENDQTKGAFNAIYNLVLNKKSNSSLSHANSSQPQAAQDNIQPADNDESEPIMLNHRSIGNAVENKKELSNLQKNVNKSREIHKKLLQRKNRWKPSELELAVLKLHFAKNRYPSKEEKEEILKNLEEKFNSHVNANQLSRWFQNEREKGVKNGSKDYSKNTYKKFSKEELELLESNFEKNTYPKTEEMVEMSKKLRVTLSKIENWYKHNRRSLAKKGDFILKTKKYFKRDEVKYLMNMFENHPRPSKEQILEIGKHLDCSELQIKNWYSNKRKKQKLVAKRQGVDKCDTDLHQASNSFFSQINSQPGEVSNSFQFNNINPVTYINGNQQAANLNMAMPATVPTQVAPVFQVQQMPNMYQNGALQQAAPVANNIYLNNTFPGNMLNMGGFQNGYVPVILIPAQNMNQTATPQPNMGQFDMRAVQQQQQQQMLLQQQQQMLLQQQQQQQQLQQQQLLKNFGTTSQASTNAPSMLSFSSTASSSGMASLSPMPAYTVKQNVGGMDLSGGLYQAQQAQQSNPVIIVSGSKTPLHVPAQQQQVSYTMPTQQTVFMPNVSNQGGMTQNNLFSGNFGQNINGVAQGNMNGTAQGMYRQDTPMQVQYLTSLYCPYSNNNIFSSYYPIVYQNTPSNPPQSNTNQASGSEAAFAQNSTPLVYQQMANTNQ